MHFTRYGLLLALCKVFKITEVTVIPRVDASSDILKWHEL